MKKSPLQTVKDKFGSRGDLIEKLAGLVDDLAGDGNVKGKLGGLSNEKLLRLYAIEQKVREKYGDRSKLEQQIVSGRQAAGLSADDAFKAKLAKCSKGELLDMTRQKLASRPAKQTPEQRLAKKRGRKARARAMSKIGG